MQITNHYNVCRFAKDMHMYMALSIVKLEYKQGSSDSASERVVVELIT